MKETVPEKAARLLSSGAVRVVEVDGSGHGRARVAGDHNRYLVTIDEHGRRCTCPAWRPCSHSLAVELVVAGREDVNARIEREGRVFGEDLERIADAGRRTIEESAERAVTEGVSRRRT